MTHYHPRVNDEVGHRIPLFLEPVFIDRQRFQKWLHGLRTKRIMLLDIAKKRAGGTELNLPRILALLEEIQCEIQKAMPYKVCDCSEAEVDCPKCGGKRWLSTAEAMTPFAG